MIRAHHCQASFLPDPSASQGSRRRIARGFTLIELIVTVAIIAILAAIALPSYNAYVVRSKLTDAQNGLANFHVQMEQYFQDNRTYGTGQCGVLLPSSRYFTFSCTLTGGAGGGYLATATGAFGSNTSGFTFSLDQTNKQQTTSVPSGWALPTSDCWITNKGGVCA